MNGLFNTGTSPCLWHLILFHLFRHLDSRTVQDDHMVAVIMKLLGKQKNLDAVHVHWNEKAPKSNSFKLKKEDQQRPLLWLIQHLCLLQLHQHLHQYPVHLSLHQYLLLVPRCQYISSGRIAI
ncbi:uncharacterized protein LOC144817730 [Lissotriton helveticus]